MASQNMQNIMAIQSDFHPIQMKQANTTTADDLDYH